MKYTLIAFFTIIIDIVRYLYKMQAMLLSIIIPAFNEVTFLQRYQQGHETYNKEIIIVDEALLMDTRVYLKSSSGEY